jgi:hypothetical protein
MSQLQVHPDRKSAVARAERDAADAPSVSEAITTLISEMARLLRADGVVVDLLRDDEATTCYAAGFASEVGRSRPIHQPLIAECLRSLEPLRSPNVRRDPRFQPPSEDMGEVVSMISIPLYVHGPAIGLVRAVSSKESHFDDEDLVLARLMTGSVGRVLMDAVRREVDQDVGLSRPGLLGPADFAARRDVQVEHAERYGYSVSLIICRLEGYLSRDVFDQMASLVRKTDDCFRLDAGEFAILMPATTLQEADSAALRIKRGIEDNVGEGSSRVRVRWESSSLVREQPALR